MLDGLILNDEHEQLGIGATVELDSVYEPHKGMVGINYGGISEWYGIIKYKEDKNEKDVVY